MKRRDFLKKAGLLAAGLIIVPTALIAKTESREVILNKLGFKKVKSIRLPYCEANELYHGNNGNLSITEYKKGCGVKHDHLSEFPWTANFYKRGQYHGPRWNSYAIDEKTLLGAIARDL